MGHLHLDLLTYWLPLRRAEDRTQLTPLGSSLGRVQTPGELS